MELLKATVTLQTTVTVKVAFYWLFTTDCVCGYSFHPLTHFILNSLRDSFMPTGLNDERDSFLPFTALIT